MMAIFIIHKLAESPFPFSGQLLVLFLLLFIILSLIGYLDILLTIWCIKIRNLLFVADIILASHVTA